MTASAPASEPSVTSRPRRTLPLVGPSAGVAPQGGVERVDPRTVRISLTDRCDLACVYCRPSRADGYVEKRLDRAAWEALVRALVAAGVRRGRLTGGEPLLHPDVGGRVGFLPSPAAPGGGAPAPTPHAPRPARP